MPASRASLALAPTAVAIDAQAALGQTCVRCAHAKEVVPNAVKCRRHGPSEYAGCYVVPDGFCPTWQLAATWLLAERETKV